MKTHVEFETGGCTMCVPRDRLMVWSHGDKWYAGFPDPDPDDDGPLPWSITPETAARLRRELLGEAESEPAAEPEFVLYRYACLDAYVWRGTFAPDEEGRRLAKAWRDLPENVGNARVVPLFVRREDATP